MSRTKIIWQNRIGLVLAMILLLFSFSNLSAQKPTFLRENLVERYADTSIRDYNIERPYFLVFTENFFPRSLQVIRQLNDKAAIVKLRNKVEFDDLSQRFYVVSANDEWKLSPYAEQQALKIKDQQAIFNLSCFDKESYHSLIKKMNNKFIILDKHDETYSLVIRSIFSSVKNDLIRLTEIVFADLRAEPKTEIGIIGYNRSFHGLSAVDYSIPGANGKNIVAGVKEQKMQESDLDLYKRVISSSLEAPTITNHATVISSIIGGAGNSFYDGRGIAYGCMFFPSSFSNLFADEASVLNTNKVSVQNHSYGTIIQQFYGAEAVSYDMQAWQNKNLIHVFSSGNQGTSFANEGQYANISGFANLTANFKMAKNIITVGAIDNKGNIPAESSSGPLYDGRMAPQLTALGPNGTSDAAAIVTGTIAVMQQVYADSNNQDLPPSSLVKSVLFNSADDIYHIGVDYKTGYGLLNSYAAIRNIQQKHYDGSSVSQDQQWIKNIEVPINVAELKVTLSWTDSAATANNSKALINDLDLEVLDVNSNIVYLPWVLNTSPFADSLNKLPTRKRDSLNTAEQVSIKFPVAGTYSIKVKGASVVSSSVSFHVAFRIDTLNTFHFANPQHTADVNRDEKPDLDIRWRTFVADTNTTGDLYVSYNNGLNWQLIKASHKIYTNYLSWPIKDTASRAVLKMNTPFGEFQSNQFVISKVVRPNIDFLCDDSVGISWNKYIYADQYKLFSLVDSPYLRHILTVSDTFVVLDRQQYSSLVYAIEPVLNNGLPASRSLAQNITLQGVKCFYKTFYYNLLDENQLDLVLEISAPSRTDSLIFEQVNLSGQVLQTVGRLKSGNSDIYQQLVKVLPTGTTYWRVKIKLKNGMSLFSEIISVLTTGKRYILFYPNPVKRNQGLTWVLQQGIFNDCRIQFFTMDGRLLKSYSEMPNSIDTNKFPPGLIVYKLYNSDGRLLETGKLFVY